jgi:hypothetical protein
MGERAVEVHTKGARSRAKTMRNSLMNDCTITAAHNNIFTAYFIIMSRAKSAFGLNLFLIDRQQKDPRAPIK